MPRLLQYLIVQPRGIVTLSLGPSAYQQNTGTMPKRMVVCLFDIGPAAQHKFGWMHWECTLLADRHKQQRMHCNLLQGCTA